jgi:hypothetical protein
LARVIIKDLAQEGNGLIQVVVAGGCFGPDPRNQIRAAKTLAAMFDENEEGIKDLGGEGNGCSVAQEAAPGGVEAKRAKLVKFPRHKEIHNNLFLLTCLPGEKLG